MRAVLGTAFREGAVVGGAALSDRLADVRRFGCRCAEPFDLCGPVVVRLCESPVGGARLGPRRCYLGGGVCRR